MQKTLIVFALLAFTAFGYVHLNQDELMSLWSSWKMYHGKSYTLSEEAARFAIFEDNYVRVIEFNAAHEDLKLALNKFSDLTPTEFKLIYASGIPEMKKEHGLSTVHFDSSDLPASVDWRSKNAVTAIKDQAYCGGCWAFCTTAALEGFFKINNGTLVSFSEEQILDCDTSDGNMGCNGGYPQQALNYTAQYGIEPEAAYPFTAGDGITGTCQYKKLLAIKANSGAALVTPSNTTAMKAAVAAQPVSVVIEASQALFHQYSSGVIKGDCGTVYDHGVTVIGYGTFGSDTSDEAFIVKNSWGTSWGQSGYVYISTSDQFNGGLGACGILTAPVVPTI